MEINQENKAFSISNSVEVSLICLKRIIRINQSMTITALLQEGKVDPRNYTFRWWVSDGTIVQQAQVNQALFTAPGHKCTVQVKVEVKDKNNAVSTQTISIIVYKQVNFLKADDMRFDPANILYPQWTRLLDYMEKRQIKMCVGLICNYLERGNAEFFNRLKRIDQLEYFEIFNHGYDHLLDKINEQGEHYWEFFNTTFEQQREHFLKGQNLVKEKLGITLHTFGAPGNKNDANTTKAIETIDDLKVWFLGDPGSSKLVLNKKRWIETSECRPDYNTFVKTYSPDEDYLVLHLHPIGWSSDDFDIYIKVLDFLVQQDVTFLLPYEYYQLMLPPTVLPQILLNRSEFTFGSDKDGHSTPAQVVRMESSTGAVLSWKATTQYPWINITPSSGSGSAEVGITVNPTGLQAGTYQGTISVEASQAVNSPQTINVRLTVYNTGATAVPFGDFATPAEGSTVSGSIAVTGWALDDIGVQSIKIYSANTYIGDGIFVEGARPDVEKAYPDSPLNYRAGWGYMLLTNCLPGGGNGEYTLNVFAVDIEGHEAKLGSKTITVDNKNAVKPFGAIDTPTQGGTASGKNFVCNGWALTPLPAVIPKDGSTIRVIVDGFDLGKPVYNLNRADVEKLFPGYANSSGAAGYYILNTTTYKNGLHTIAWIVTDDKGNTDGIGSRYFNINN